MLKEFNYNLQLFAEGDEGNAQGGEGATGEGAGDNNTPETFTKEEVDKMLQSETDKRVSEAIKTSKSKWQEEFKSKIEQERKEAERLAKLSSDEKRQEELKKKNEEISQKESELRKRELKLDTINVLSEKQLPVEFSDFLMGNDAEATNVNIKRFGEAFSKSIESAVNERLRGNSPKGGQGGNKVDFSKMSDEEYFKYLENKNKK